MLLDLITKDFVLTRLKGGLMALYQDYVLVMNVSTVDAVGISASWKLGTPLLILR